MLTSDRLLARAACASMVCARINVFLIIYLYSGEVFQGTWNKTPVALKVLKADGVPASSNVRPPEMF